MSFKVKALGSSKVVNSLFEPPNWEPQKDYSKGKSALSEYGQVTLLSRVLGGEVVGGVGRHSLWFPR